MQALLECLSQQGIRESALRKSLKEQMEAITDGIKKVCRTNKHFLGGQRHFLNHPSADEKAYHLEIPVQS